MVYRSRETEIPEGCCVSRDGTVVFLYRDGEKSRRTIVGYRVRDGVMNPNSSYFTLFPDHWRKTHPDEPALPHPPALHTGLFALALSAGNRTGIYPLLVQACGPEAANAVMDLAMYTLLPGAGGEDSFSALMQDQLLFSIRPHDPGWYGDMFSSSMDETRTGRFLTLWLNHCLQKGTGDVYLYAGGMPGQGSPVSDRTGKAAAAVWALGAGGRYRGVPVSCFLLDTGKEAGSALRDALAFFDKVNVKGILCSGECCTEEAVRAFQEEKLPFLFRLGPDTACYAGMMRRHGEEIRGNLEHGLFRDYCYGTADTAELFPGSGLTVCTGLVFREDRAVQGKAALSSRVRRAASEFREAAAEGRPYAVPEDLQPYLVQEDEGSSVSICSGALQEAAGRMGFEAFASSEERTPEEMLDIWDAAVVLEETLPRLGAELFPRTEPLPESGILSRCIVCLAASVIRAEAEAICRKADPELDFDSAVEETAEAAFLLQGSSYRNLISCQGTAGSVLKRAGVDEQAVRSLSSMADMRFQADEGVEPRAEMRKFDSRRPRGRPRKTPAAEEEPKPDRAGKGTETVPDRRQDAEEKPKRPRGRPRKEKPPAEDRPKGKPGRKPGSKNRATLERERRIAAGELQIPEKRPPGRPKLPSTEAKEQEWKRFREEAASYGIILPEKRSRGRQKSMDTLLREAGILRDQKKPD